jgi:predicted alpha/beta superfamily hydrolase
MRNNLISIKLRIFIFLLFLFIASFAQSQTNGDRKPFVLGYIEEIQSKILSEKRTLNIYLPDGYKESDSARYPVIYLLDGSADEDFIHVVGLIQFNNFPWISRVPKSIVVGISNVDRRRDFTFSTTVKEDQEHYKTSGKSDQFISFIEKELQPYIARKCRTNASRMIIGQSLGGLLATEILLKKPNLFDKYVIISPSLWWDNGSLLNQSSGVLASPFNQKTAIYIGVGKEGLTPGPNPRVMEVDANLLYEKINEAKNKNVNVYFDYLPQEDHGTVTHQAVFNALRLLYPLTNDKNN